MSDNVRKVEFLLGKETITIETGALAKQANGAVLITAGETVVLVTAAASAKPKAGADFFPLTVDYRENTGRQLGRRCDDIGVACGNRAGRHRIKLSGLGGLDSAQSTERFHRLQSLCPVDTHA